MLLALSLSASPIGEKRAREIATNFFSSASTTRSGSTPAIELEWAGCSMEQGIPYSNPIRTRSAKETSDESLMYIYNRTDAKGFVIVAGDDCAKRDIIAFSHDNSFNATDIADGARAMLQVWCEDIADARKKGIKPTITRASSTGNVVCQYKTAKWGQSKPYYNECPLIDGARAKTGCGATAAAIICYYHKLPEKGTGSTGSYTYTRNGTRVTVPNNDLGRTYNYDKMLMSYKSGYTDEQAAAVAALMYDIGSAAHIGYGVESTGANAASLAKAFIKYFNFSKDMIFLPSWSYTDSEWLAMLKQNLDTHGPTYYCGRDVNDGGHLFVLDGYTDTDYFSINYGWEGGSNGFYLLPTIGYRFKQQAIFNMVPDKDGTSDYRYCLMLESKTISGVKYKGLETNATKFAVGSSFQVTAIVTNKGLSDFKGQFCIAHCDKDNNIKSTLYLRNLTDGKISSSGYKANVSIRKEVEAGDRLLAFYKGANENVWSRMRNHSETTTDCIMMCASAEEVAKSTAIEYNKATKSLTFSSPHTTQCTITNSASNSVASAEIMGGDSKTIDLSALPSGEYTLSFASGGEPYLLNIKL